MGLFGPVPISCSDLGKQLIERVRAENLTEESNIRGIDTAWSNAWKGALREIGQGLGFNVIHSTKGPPKKSELLLDLIWYSDAGGIELGAECQWNHILGDDMKDIKKVVYVKAPLKVLIWWDESKSGQTGNRIRREIETYLKKYGRHVRGEEYLCVEFGIGHRDRCDWYVVPNDGTVSSVSLLPIQLS
ncbi:MAG: hypothetical protein WBQ43_12710 [Terriglobales bacterium]